jgi:hypothetical protein
LNPLIFTIILGKKEPLIAPSNLIFTVESAYPFEPFILNDTSTETQEDVIQVKEKEEKLIWTKEMIEQLVNTLYEVFKKERAANNSLKRLPLNLLLKTLQRFTKELSKSLNNTTKTNREIQRRNRPIRSS